MPFSRFAFNRCVCDTVSRIDLATDSASSLNLAFVILLLSFPFIFRRRYLRSVGFNEPPTLEALLLFASGSKAWNYRYELRLDLNLDNCFPSYFTSIAMISPGNGSRIAGKL